MRSPVHPDLANSSDISDLHTTDIVLSSEFLLESTGQVVMRNLTKDGQVKDEKLAELLKCTSHPSKLSCAI